MYSLSAATINQLLIKEKSDAMIAVHRYQMMKWVLRQIESDPELDQLLCRIPITSVRDMASYSTRWWQTYGCRKTEKNRLYYYAVEYMGNDDCGVMSDVDAASYYRITLVTIDDLTDEAGWMIQSSIVLPHKRMYPCAGYAHHVAAGQQMLRQIQG